MNLKSYETIFVMTPVLSEEQSDGVIGKFRSFLQGKDVDLVHEEKMGIKRLAYPINRHTTGIYHLFEFKASPSVVNALEIAYRREEHIMRFLTYTLDKYGVAYNKNKREEPKKGERAIN